MKFCTKHQSTCRWCHCMVHFQYDKEQIYPKNWSFFFTWALIAIIICLSSYRAADAFQCYFVLRMFKQPRLWGSSPWFIFHQMQVLFHSHFQKWNQWPRKINLRWAEPMFVCARVLFFSKRNLIRSHHLLARVALRSLWDEFSKEDNSSEAAMTLVWSLSFRNFTARISEEDCGMQMATYCQWIRFSSTANAAMGSLRDVRPH